MSDDMALSAEEFSRKYIEPAIGRLTDDLKAGRPISDLDRKVLISCGYNPDEVIAFYKSQLS
jgi:hypothetical protein